MITMTAIDIARVAQVRETTGSARPESGKIGHGRERAVAAGRRFRDGLLRDQGRGSRQRGERRPLRWASRGAASWPRHRGSAETARGMALRSPDSSMRPRASTATARKMTHPGTHMMTPPSC